MHQRCVPSSWQRKLRLPLASSVFSFVPAPRLRAALPLHPVAAALVAFTTVLIAGCSSNETLSPAEKAKRVTVLRKEAAEQLAIFSASADDPDGVDFDALSKYVELQGETTKIAPATCPLCFSNYAEALSRLGLYYNTLVRAAERDLKDASGQEKADLTERAARYRKKMNESFRESTRQFQNYFMSCRSNGQPVDPEMYRWALRNSEFLQDFHKAIYYLELYEANVTLTEEAKRNAEKLRASYRREIERQEEERLRRELDNG